MSNFLNWLDQSSTATIIGLCALFAVALLWQRKEYREQRKAERAALRVRVNAAIEEVHAHALRVEELARERDNLLQCNMELQQEIYQRDQQIKELTPYQVIPSIMMWGRN